MYEMYEMHTAASENNGLVVQRIHIISYPDVTNDLHPYQVHCFTLLWLILGTKHILFGLGKSTGERDAELEKISFLCRCVTFGRGTNTATVDRSIFCCCICCLLFVLPIAIIYNSKRPFEVR